MATQAAVKQRISAAEEALRVEKTEARRADLADAALETLGTLGYARTSLREIAQNTAFTHGLFHYYFTDKVDLICCSVRRYKAICVTRYDDVVATANTRDEMMEGFLRALGDTIRNDSAMHRLWYDLRAQALFEQAFRADVVEIDHKLEDMVWRVATRYAELGGRTPTVSSSVLYAVLDGLFQKCLLAHLSGEPDAIPAFLSEVRNLLPRIC
jgi:AcrR family transcriptional regulator